MPSRTGTKQKCHICGRVVREHTTVEAKKCGRAVHKLMFDTLKPLGIALHARELTSAEPDRIANGQVCVVCGCFLPGDWGDAPAYPKRQDMPSARMCGQCLRDIDHDCHKNALHVMEQDSYMGSGDGADYWKCKICHRRIGVGEFIKKEQAAQ